MQYLTKQTLSLLANKDAKMNAPCPLPTGRCADHEFRLTVYEAGHALTARALELKILSVQMFPRPPMLVSDKTFSGNTIAPLILMLENRVIELFGGQIAEVEACASNTCCSGDVSRIDELCRLIAGLKGAPDPETVWFELEDVAESIFKNEQYRNAIMPMAEFLHQQVLNGAEIIDGDLIEAELDKHVPAAPKAKKGFLSFGKKKQKALKR